MTGGIRGLRILVTGTAGLVGHSAASRLAAEGADVTAVGGRTEPDRSGLQLDLARDSWPAGPWDAIVHCAARLPMRFDGPDADACVAQNRAVDDRAIALAAAANAHLVFFSSASVYGGTVGRIDEATPVAPLLGYARGKLETEAAIAARGVSATVFRLVAPYGPRQTRPTVLYRFLEAALEGSPLRYYGTGTRTQDFLHVDDVATAITLALAARAPGTFLLASGMPISMRELAEVIVSVTGSNSAVEAAGVPDPEEGRAISYRIDHIRERLGFQPSVMLADGIAAWAAARRSGRAPSAAP
jgi:UDP-glucose 4-epimerase